jgi:hypothetical protein
MKRCVPREVCSKYKSALNQGAHYLNSPTQMANASFISSNLILCCEKSSRLLWLGKLMEL